jgi:hypothetical protein
LVTGLKVMLSSAPSTVTTALPPESALLTPVTPSTAEIVAVPCATASIRLLLPSELVAVATPDAVEL